MEEVKAIPWFDLSFLSNWIGQWEPIIIIFFLYSAYVISPSLSLHCWLTLTCILFSISIHKKNTLITIRFVHFVPDWKKKHNNLLKNSMHVRPRASFLVEKWWGWAGNSDALIDFPGHDMRGLGNCRRKLKDQGPFLGVVCCKPYPAILFCSSPSAFFCIYYASLRRSYAGFPHPQFPVHWPLLPENLEESKASLCRSMLCNYEMHFTTIIGVLYASAHI